MADAKEHQETVADRRDLAVVDAHRGATDPLEERAHAYRAYAGWIVARAVMAIDRIRSTSAAMSSAR